MRLFNTVPTMMAALLAPISLADFVPQRCHAENVFSTEQMSVTANDATVAVVYDAGVYGVSLNNQDVKQLVRDVGLLEDGETLHRIQVLGRRSGSGDAGSGELVQLASDPRVFSVVLGQPLAYVSFSRREAPDVIDVRSAELAWANFRTSLVTTVQANGLVTTVLQGKIEFYRPGFDYYPFFDREYSCSSI